MRKRDYIREEKIRKELEAVASSIVDGILNNAIENGASISKNAQKIIKDCYIKNYVEGKEIILCALSDMMSEVDTFVHRTNNGYPVFEYNALGLCETIEETFNKMCRLLGVTNPDDV